MRFLKRYGLLLLLLLLLAAVWVGGFSAGPYGGLVAVFCWFAAAAALFFLWRSWEGGAAGKRLLCAVCVLALALSAYGPLARHSRYFHMFTDVEIESVEELTWTDRCRLALFWRDRPDGLCAVTVLAPDSGYRSLVYCPESEVSAVAAGSGERYDVSCERYGLDDFAIRGEIEPRA